MIKNLTGEKVADYKHYLIYFIQHIQRKGGKVIFMTTPPKNYADRKTFKICARVSQCNAAGCKRS